MSGKRNKGAARQAAPAAGRRGAPWRGLVAAVCLVSCPIVGVIAATLPATATAGAEEQAPLIALAGGRVLTASGPVIDPGTVVIRGDRIAVVAANVRLAAGARVIDVTGSVVMPGMIDPQTALGLIEVEAVPQTVDHDEASDPLTPQMRVIDAIYPESAWIPVARAAGVTSVLVAPGQGNVIAGQSAFVNLFGRTVDEMVLRFPLAMHANLGEPPKARWGEKQKMPSTRMGIAALLRQTLIQAEEYAGKHERYADRMREERRGDEEAPKPPERDLRLESLVPVVRGEIPLVVRAHRADDIMTAVRIAEEFDLRLILVHATEAHLVAAELARRRIPVIVGPVSIEPSSMETLGATYENAALLAEAGVLVAITTGDPYHGVRNVCNLPYEAGLAVAYGLPWEEAVRAITLNPARILGVDDLVGSIAEGKLANLVVMDGDPLEIRTQVQHVFIAGREVPLTSHHTDLWEQYRGE